MITMFSPLITHMHSPGTSQLPPVELHPVRHTAGKEIGIVNIEFAINCSHSTKQRSGHLFEYYTM